MSEDEKARSAVAQVIELAELRLRIAALEAEREPLEFKLSQAVRYDEAKTQRIKQLEAELGDWRLLRDPEHLCNQIAEGVPAQLDLRHVQRLLVLLQLAAEIDEQ